MAYILEYAFLLCLVKLVFSKNLYFVDLSGNQTWYDTYNDNHCLMPGLALEGYFENVAKHMELVLSWDPHWTGWIGAHAKRVWINFEGCHHGIFRNNYTSTLMTSRANPAKDCLRYCNFNRFVLTEKMCVCYKDVKTFSTECAAGNCVNTKYLYCGRGSARDSNNVTTHCMCHFSMENNDTDISGDGDCLAVQFQPYGHPPKYVAKDCDRATFTICRLPNTNEGFKVWILRQWLDIFPLCFERKLQLGNRSTSYNLPDNNINPDWIGTFAETYMYWGPPTSNTDKCVAVLGTYKPIAFTCDTFHPALCINSSLLRKTTSSSYNSHSTTSSVLKLTDVSTTKLNTTTVTSVLRQITTLSYQSESVSSPRSDGTANQKTTRLSVFPSENLSSPMNIPTVGNQPTDTPQDGQSQTKVIVGSVTGGFAIVIVLTVIVLLLRRHVIFRKYSTSTDAARLQGNDPHNTNGSYLTQEQASEPGGYGNGTYTHLPSTQKPGTPHRFNETMTTAQL